MSLAKIQKGRAKQARRPYNPGEILNINDIRINTCQGELYVDGASIFAVLKHTRLRHNERNSW